MGARTRRFVGKAIPGQGWRVWDNVQRKWWGNLYTQHPAELLAELNGKKRPDRIVELSKGGKPAKTSKQPDRLSRRG
jgi:hypothetical protein